MLWGTLRASLLGNLLTEKGLLIAGSGRPLSSSSKNNKRKGILRAGSGYPLSSTLKNNKKEWDF